MPTRAGNIPVDEDPGAETADPAVEPCQLSDVPVLPPKPLSVPVLACWSWKVLSPIGAEEDPALEELSAEDEAPRTVDASP